jgi:uncharacterized protein YcbK (DUF882 family)
MLNLQGNRRSFLKFSMAGALMLFGVKPAIAKTALEEGLPEGKLSLYNTHTQERMTIAYRNHAGEYDPEALASLNWILRCHYTNETTEMDTRVIEYLNMVDNQFGGSNEIHIISGYRSPEYNRLLRREGRGVAKHSQHLLGKAIDFCVPNISLASLRNAARNLCYGGVGYYPRTGFVHIDSGNFRTW